MEKKKPRIIFMGTPELAAHVLRIIIDKGYPVAGVVTAPDKPAGRGKKKRHSEVKQVALEHELPLLQPESLKDETFIKSLRVLQPDIQVVVAFRMLPESVWALPPTGTFNLHASLLPDYRGAAPINWVIINGEQRTGVSTFLIDHKIDTGNILFRKEIDIAPYETAGTLHEKVKAEGAPLVIQTIEALIDGTVQPKSQEQFTDEVSQLHKAPKIYKEDCRVRWDKTAQEVANLIHGLSPRPGAFCDITDVNDKQVRLKIYEARPELTPHHFAPGTMLTDNRKNIRFATPDGFVHVRQLQLEGKRRMETEELLRGTTFPPSQAC